MRKFIFYIVNLTVFTLVCPFKVHGQEAFNIVIDVSANSYIGSYLALHSVTLTPGFTVTASSTTTFHAYIEGHEPLPVDPTIPQNNVVRTDVIKVAGAHSDNDILSLTTANKQIQTQYIYSDGMGRPLQTVQSQASPALKDVIQPATYDSLGRSSTQYLPYTSTTNTGAWQTNAAAAQAAFYNTANQKIAVDASPFAVTAYDASPLERPLEQGGVGQDWQPGSGHTVKNVYRLNAANEVQMWTTAGTGGYYAANLLSVVETTDENGNTVHSYFNQIGQTILKRVDFNENITENGVTTMATYLDTYYVYDDLGHLIYQLPPKAVAKIAGGATWNAGFISQWVFNYAYDNFGRVVQKQTPGSAPVYLVYNQMDQVVMTQDGNLGATNRWYFIKYDQAHRPLMSGIYTYTDPMPGVSGTPQVKLQAYYNSLNYDGSDKYYEERLSIGTHAYTTQSFPISGLDIETVNYYDSYDIYGSGNGAANFSYVPQGLTGENTVAATCNGMPVASKKKVVGSNTQWLVNVNFYDKYGRPIQQCKNNHVGLAVNVPNPATLNDITTSVYNFDGTVAITKSTKVVAGNTITAINKLTYDTWQRLAQVTQSNNGAADQVVGKYAYNEIGQLVDKNLHQKTDGTFLQSVDYRYNIRGWLTNINSADLAHNTNSGDAPDLFGMDFSYDLTETGFIDGTTYKPYFNGEIAAVKWQVASDATTTRPERSYRYTYDKANRMRKSYSAALSGTTWSTELGGYNENADYDQNGNLLHLDRNTMYNGSVFTMDNLTYSYTVSSTTYGNQLQKVDDAVANTVGMTEFKDNANTAQEYTYDGDGNLLTDANKGSAGTPVHYTYNDINKVSKVDFGSGNYVTYTYDATGARLQRLVYAAGALSKTFDYLDGFIYQNNTLVSLPMPEGRVTVAAGVFQYEYIIKDNQGNSRVSFILGSSGTATLLQENHYYPFGMTLKGSTTVSTLPATPNQYLYNGGSELQEDNGSNIYSTFYREYDPALARFNSVDVGADDSGSESPYSFAGNNPVMFNDPAGDEYDPNRGLYVSLTNFNENPFDQWLAAANAQMNADGFYDPWYATQQAYEEAETADYFAALRNGTLPPPPPIPGATRVYEAGGDSHLAIGIRNGEVIYTAVISGAGSNTYDVLYPKDPNDPYTLNGNVPISQSDAFRLLGQGQSDSNVNQSDNSPRLKSEQDDSNNNSFWPHLIGPTLITLGQPIKYLKPIGMLGSKPGSSIASFTLRKIVPGTLKGTFGESIGGAFVELAGTNGLGAALGRLVPIVGVAWTLGDLQSWGFHYTIDHAPNDQVKEEMLDAYSLGL